MSETVTIKPATDEVVYHPHCAVNGLKPIKPEGETLAAPLDRYYLRQIAQGQLTIVNKPLGIATVAKPVA